MAYTQGICDKLFSLFFFLWGGGAGFKILQKKIHTKKKKKTLVRVLPRHEIGHFFLFSRTWTIKVRLCHRTWNIRGSEGSPCTWETSGQSKVVRSGQETVFCWVPVPYLTMVVNSVALFFFFSYLPTYLSTYLPTYLLPQAGCY
jgi:hypothetical protein